MTSRLRLVSDGSAETAALARFLAAHLDDVEHVEARSAADAIRAAKKENQRQVLLVDEAAPESDVPAEAAVMVVRRWLETLAPIDRRTEGAQVIAQHLEDGAPGSEHVVELRRRLRTAEAALRIGTTRGRPKGSNPFEGTGLATCLTLLDAPNARWTERALAEHVGATPSVIHKTLAELDRRGYRRRTRGATVLREPATFATDLLSVWRAKAKVPRAARAFHSKSPDPFDVLATHAAPTRVLCAGWSALEEDVPIGGALQIYAQAFDDSWTTDLDLAPVPLARASVVVWEAPSAAVFEHARTVHSRPATRASVTWLDLRLLGEPRAEEAAKRLFDRMSEAE